MVYILHKHRHHYTLTQIATCSTSSEDNSLISQGWCKEYMWELLMCRVQSKDVGSHLSLDTYIDIDINSFVVSHKGFLFMRRWKMELWCILSIFYSTDTEKSQFKLIQSNRFPKCLKPSCTIVVQKWPWVTCFTGPKKQNSKSRSIQGENWSLSCYPRGILIKWKLPSFNFSSFGAKTISNVNTTI